jgi:CubicO group peptidase (beta-lactamase class C family)
MKTGHLLGFILMFHSPMGFGQQTTRRQQAVEQASKLHKIMDSLKVQAVSVAVIDHYHLAWAKGYGVADRSTGCKVNTKTLFQAASISKTVNALLIVRLAAAGQIPLNTDIRKYLTRWHFPDN